MTAPRLVKADELNAVLRLIQRAFAEQAGRIDPPSSMNSLTTKKIAAHHQQEPIWGIEDQSELVACMFGNAQGEALYLSKLSVAPKARGQGLAAQLFATAESYARENGFRCLEVIARVELTENHQMFEHLGFEKCGEGRHPGYDRTTELHFRKPI
jgi:GNAT superfamily N-acetyltransferase